MRKKFEIKLLKSIKAGAGLIKLINNLKKHRKAAKLKGLKRTSLSKKARVAVFLKTDGHCHICGIVLDLHNFQADHVKSHVMGGSSAESNYLPSCPTCNNYRRHFTPEEMTVILKLGVWAKTKIVTDPVLGKEMAKQFVKHDMRVRKRRVGKK